MRQKSFKSVLLAAAVLVPCAAAVPRVAFADDDKVMKAAVLSREAEKLLADGKTDDACDKYEQSQKFDPRGETLLDLALCREKQGRTGTAYNLFIQADKVAQDEKRNDRSQTAKQHMNALFAKLARLTVVVPKDAMTEGLAITAGDQTIPEEQWGKAFVVDTGDLKITASAPGKATWETSIQIKGGYKKSLTLQPLAAGAGPTPKPTADVPVTAPTPTPVETAPVTPPPVQEPPPKPLPVGHHGKRVVADLQVLAGMHVSAVTQAPQALITGTQYAYNGDGGSQFLASCGDESSVPGAGSCNATFNPQLALLAGAQLFVGYALSEKVELGGRVFGSFHFPLGFTFLGGPSLSVKTKGPLWLGATALVGTSQVTATVTGARGSVPDEFQSENPGGDVVIGPKGLAGGLAGGTKTAVDWARVEIGGAMEISLSLTDTTSGATGGLLLSAWPTAMWNPGGGVSLDVPIGLGYRFY